MHVSLLLQELNAIKDEYKKQYENNLEDDLRGDASGDFEEMLIELTKAEREQGDTVNQEKAEQDADTIHKVCYIYTRITVQS